MQTVSTTGIKQVLDSLGQPISIGSVVRMSNPKSVWAPYEGLVVASQSDEEGDSRTVAVFFNNEVPSHRFSSNKIQWWDDEKMSQCQKGETGFLFNEVEWKKCPRVCFFMPAELEIIPYWSLDVVIERTFKTKYWAVRTLVAPFDMPPQEYQCWMDECYNPAVHHTVCNVWGTIYTYACCHSCHKKWHGLRPEIPPTMDRSIYYADGRPVTYASD